MPFIGIVIGLILGAILKSVPAAIFLATMGGGIAYAMHRKRQRENRDDHQPSSEFSRLVSLESQVESMAEQMRRMTNRLHLLEQQLQIGSDAAVPANPGDVAAVENAEHGVPDQNESAPAPVDLPSVGAPTIADTEAGQAENAVRDGAISGDLNLLSAASVHATATLAVQAPPGSGVDPATLQTASESTVAQHPPQLVPQAVPDQPRLPRPPTPPAEPSRFTAFIQNWVIGGNPILKIGVVLLFLGLAFLLRYVAEHTVVPIELRYAGVAAVGIALLLGGWRWRHRNDNYGLILQGAGIGVLYLTTLAAMKLQALLPPEFGFAVLIVVAVFAALLAILQDSLALAVIGTLGGFAAPVLTSTGQDHHIAFFTYLAVINLGIVLIAWFKAWRVLNLLGFVCTFLLGSATAAKFYRPEAWQTWEPFLLLLFVMYVLITFLFARRTLAEAPETGTSGFGRHLRQSAARVSYVDGILAFGVPLATFGLQMLLVKHVEYGAAYSALGFGLAYIVLAFALFRGSGMRYALLSETMIALAVIFGSLAIPLGLEQQWTSAAWSVEAAGVYWVGIRQQRLHARLFALLLLFGSAIYFALGIHVDTAADPVLDGSLLGSAMLALSSWWMYRLLRLSTQDGLHRFEIALRPWLIASGAFFIALLPFLLWPMNWAGTALAILGATAVFAAQRLSERALRNWAFAYQALAGALYISTLHSTSGGSVLANGWAGLFAASLIGASMLAGAWAMTRQNLGDATDDAAQNSARAFSGIASLGLLAGLVFINLAPLFVLPWRFAAMIWPLTGIATLWWAIRARHTAAIGFALALQLVAGVAHFGSRLLTQSGETADLLAFKPFMHTGFWGPILISLAAFLCARLLHKKSPSSTDTSLGWIALFWAGAWWSFGWTDEIVRVAPAELVSACLVGIAIATASLWSEIARRLPWPQLGQATLAYLPALILLAAAEFMSPVPHPLAGWGALAWPLALLTHGVLLRRQTTWVNHALLGLAHTIGAWLFVVLAALELRWQFAHWANPDSAWPLLGWMIAPVLYLWCLASGRLKRRWPLREHHDAYVVVAALPMAAYLFCWIWITNVISDGAAAPLPYIPLLNPLEIAQAAIMLGTAIWWWSLREHAVAKDNQSTAIATIGATAMAALTGSVVRSCHHWGGILWQADALIASHLVQTSLSVAWSIVAIGLMLAGNRNRKRWVWIVGACLIAVVVAKLFLVELAATGSLARIVSFIVVGLLLLLVGYFAPLPPKQTTETPTDPV